MIGTVARKMDLGFSRVKQMRNTSTGEGRPWENSILL